MKFLRRTALYVALFVYQMFTSAHDAVQLWSGLATFLALTVPFVLSVVEWWRYRYRLTPEVLHIQSGILRRKDRRIPVDRIQDLSSQAGLLHRVLGVIVLSVQTSSTQGAEAELDAISKQAAWELRQALGRVTELGGRSDGDRSEVQTPGRRETDPPLLVVRGGDLVLRGLTDNRAGLVLAGLVATVDRVVNIGGDQLFRRLVGGLRLHTDPVLGADSAGAVLLGAAVLSLVWLVGWVASAVVNAVRFYGFRLSESNHVFLRSYGLFTQHEQALPRRRLQTVRIEQTWLRRLLGLAVMRTDDMGSGAHEKSAQKAGTDVFVPAAPRAALLDLVEPILPGSRVHALHWIRTSPRVIRRRAVLGLWVGGALAVSGYFVLGVWSALALIVVAPAALWGWALHRTLGYARGDMIFGVRSGILGRDMTLVPVEKVQAVDLRQTPFDRRYDVASLRITVGGGASVLLPNLPLGDARELAHQLARLPAFE